MALTDSGFRVLGLRFWVLGPCVDLVDSLDRGPQYRFYIAIILTIGTPKKVPSVVGNPCLSYNFIGYACSSGRQLL